MQHVPDFRVAHEAIAETNSKTVRVERTMAVVLGNRVHVRGVGVLNGMALDAFLGRDAPAIVDAA